MADQVATSIIAGYVAATSALLDRAQQGLDAIQAEAAKTAAALAAATAGPAPSASFHDAALFATVRDMLGGRLSAEQFKAIKDAIDRGFLPAGAVPTIGISAADYEWAAKRLGWSIPQIKAVDITESAGGGWFTDVRASIIALDGPGGFLDGKALPKILYEAHVFARNCDPPGQFNDQFPNLSSAKWNKALYVGGQGEYERLWKAIQLDRNAAFSAVSVGRYQILGENHKAAGFGTAEGFFDAMCVSERAHLEAFVTFIINSGLVDEGRRISAVEDDNVPFAKGYNGPQAQANGYPAKLAAHYRDALKS